jgi:hypothetical protein
MNEVRVVKMEVVDWFVFKGVGFLGIYFTMFFGGNGRQFILFYYY